MAVLVRKKAPAFSCQAVVNGSIVDQVSLDHFKDKNVILFFYPLDFTFVCPTELHAFQEAIDAFKKRNSIVVGCSVDSAFTHLAWIETPKAKGGIEGVTYPLLSDLNKTIARDYGILCEEMGVALRALFLIDRQQVVRHQLVNDLPLGRSIPEALRMLDALLAFEEHGEVCPANWKPGSKQMKPSQDGLKEYFH